MEFKKVKQELQQSFSDLIKGQEVLYVTDVSKDDIWQIYLDSYADAETRQEHNCSACRHFLKPYANVVAIKDNKVVSMWDFDCDLPYKPVMRHLNKLVISAPIKGVFVSKESKLGIDFNHQQKDDEIIKWDHFYLELPKHLLLGVADKSVEEVMGNYKAVKDVFKRSLEEITLDSLETVLELISQNSIYRGEEFKGMIQAFLRYKKEYIKLPDNEKDNYAWANSTKGSVAVSKIRNSAIGT